MNLSQFVLPYLVIPYLALPCHILPYITLPWLAVPNLNSLLSIITDRSSRSMRTPPLPCHTKSLRRSLHHVSTCKRCHSLCMFHVFYGYQTTTLFLSFFFFCHSTIECRSGGTFATLYSSFFSSLTNSLIAYDIDSIKSNRSFCLLYLYHLLSFN